MARLDTGAVVVRGRARTRSQSSPSPLSRRHISRSAMDVFARRGFEGTTLDEVADAAGVSLTAVLDCYPSTSAIVEDGQERTLRVLSGELEAVPDGVPWRSALVEVLLAAQHHPSEDLEVLRRRVQLTGAVPALREHSHDAAERARAVLASFIARRTGAAPDDLLPFALARAVWAADQAGLAWWAASDEPDPRPCVRAGLAAIGFTSP